MSVMLKFDPEQLPIVAVKQEAAVPLSRLSESAVRERFKHPPIWQPELVDERLLPQYERFKPAAVLLPLVVREDGLHMLLTQRAAHLHDHPSQISFPGGRFEESDSSIIETALREAYEEIGLEREHIDIIGCLPQHKTGTGYEVTPVVSLVRNTLSLKSDPFEVASIFEVPLSFLMSEENHQQRVLELPNGAGQRVFYAMPYGEYFIWGATAAMLRNLFHFLRA